MSISALAIIANLPNRVYLSGKPSNKEISQHVMSGKEVVVSVNNATITYGCSELDKVFHRNAA